MKYFNSIVFKYKNQLLLGHPDVPGEQLTKFKPITYSDEKYNNLKENQFCIVQVGIINNERFSLDDLYTLTLHDDNDDDKIVIIGDLDIEDLFEEANSQLTKYSNITRH